MGHIYKHTSPSGKAYIGQSVRTMEERWKQHVGDALTGRDTSRVFHRAIRKFGPDAFTHEILHDGIDDQEELNRLEIEAIAQHGTLAPDGYNMTPGGETGPVKGTAAHSALVVVMQSPEYRAAKSAFMKDLARTPEYRAKVSKRSKKLWENEDHRDKISNSMVEYWSDEENRAKRIEAMRAAAQMPEYRSKKRAQSKKLWEDPAYRKRVTELAAEACRAPERRKKISETALKLWSDPEHRAARVAKMREVAQSPENRKRLSDAAKRAAQDPILRAKRSAAMKQLQLGTVPSVFVEGKAYANVRVAHEHLGVKRATIQWRCNAHDSRKFKWWFYLPHHNDPECDAVEECWALMQFAEACPDHESVPDWLRPERPKHGAVPAGFWS